MTLADGWCHPTRPRRGARPIGQWSATARGASVELSEPRKARDGTSNPLRRTSTVDRLVLNVLILLSWLAWIIPWPVWQATSFSAGLVGMCFRPRRAVLANIRHARATAPPSAFVAWYLATQQIATHYKTIIGTLRTSVR